MAGGARFLAFILCVPRWGSSALRAVPPLTPCAPRGEVTSPVLGSGRGPRGGSRISTSAPQCPCLSLQGPRKGFLGGRMGEQGPPSCFQGAAPSPGVLGWRPLCPVAGVFQSGAGDVAPRGPNLWKWVSRLRWPAGLVSAVGLI